MGSLIRPNITARNYAAQAERGIQYFLRNMHSTYAEFDWSFLRHVADTIGRAIHFALPDGGRLLDDGFRGIIGQNVRLPYPCITVEYWTPQDRENPKLPNVVHKRLAFARERQSDDGYFDIEISVVNFSEERRLWFPLMMGAMVRWNAKDATLPIAPIDLSGDITKRVKIPFSPIPVYPVKLIENYISSEIDPALAMRYLIHDIGDEITAVLDMIEALSCVNVSHEPLFCVDESVNRKRIRKGKLPLYETRSLIVNVPSSHSEGNGKGTHASPRQHLRRGHIRRLPNKNVWVNAHLVGKRGFIQKDYMVACDNREVGDV